MRSWDVDFSFEVLALGKMSNDCDVINQRRWRRQEKAKWHGDVREKTRKERGGRYKGES